MAGHSKWANIRARKGVQDAKRGKVFTKLIREITVAARTAGGDPAMNPRLRHAIDKALSQNMPKDNIERAIKRGTGELAGTVYEEVCYEGYAPGGVAVLVECTTDNRNRTVGEVRHAFSKHGGNLGAEGSVSYLFARVGVLNYEPGANENLIMELAIEAAAEDVAKNDDGSIDVITTPEDFQPVLETLKAANLVPHRAELVQRASADVALSGEDAERVMTLLEALDDIDDVQSVYSNAGFPDEFLQKAAI